jgi:magnesium transporter
MISIYCWNAAQQTCQWLSVDVLRQQADSLRDSTHVLWIDLADPTPDEERLVLEEFCHVHPLTLEDVTRLRREPESPPHFPKVEEFPTYLFVIVNPLVPHVVKALKSHGPEKRPADLEARGRSCTQLSAVLTRRVLVTHHYAPVAGVEELRTALSKHEAKGERGPDYLFHLILDALVDQYAPVLDHFDNALDEIEIKVFGKPTQRLLMRLLQLKREIILLRKTLIYEREVLARLSRGEFALIGERETAYYRNVYDHLVRFTELIESSREMVSDLLQTHLAAAANRLNEIMKVLTMISTVILPMTLIAGIYGMNFEHMPERNLEWGYPFALLLMALVGGLAFLFFRWKKWI